MKNVSRSPRKKARLPEHLSPVRAQEFDRRLLAYALAGAGAVALTPAASAEIVYTPADITLNRGSLPIDLNNDGTIDFTVENHESTDSGFSAYTNAQLIVGGRATESVGIVGKKLSSVPFAMALSKDTPIGPASPFVGVRSKPVIMDFAYCYPLAAPRGKSPTDCNVGGQWFSKSGAFLGFEFTINGELHYGWARFSVRTTPESHLPLIRAKFTGYVYETEANQPINAGDTGLSSQDAGFQKDRNQEPASAPTLGALAQGSQGLRALRRRQLAQGSSQQSTQPEP